MNDSECVYYFLRVTFTYLRAIALKFNALVFVTLEIMLVKKAAVFLLKSLDHSDYRLQSSIYLFGK